MKTKDIVYLAISAVAFGIAAFVLITLLGGHGTSSQVSKSTVEVVAPISPDFSQEALNTLTDTKQTQDFTPLIDPNSGLGNARPFNPL